MLGCFVSMSVFIKQTQKRESRRQRSGAGTGWRQQQEREQERAVRLANKEPEVRQRSGGTKGELGLQGRAAAASRRPPPLALVAAAGDAVVVPGGHLMHRGAHGPLASVGAGVECAGAADRDARVGRRVLRGGEHAGLMRLKCRQQRKVACRLFATPRPPRHPLALHAPWPGCPCAAAAAARCTRARTQSWGRSCRPAGCCCSLGRRRYGRKGLWACRPG